MAESFPDNICGQEVFQKLFFEYSRNLRNFLYYKSGDAMLAEDLCQEAFLRLWKECRNVPYEKAKSFLFTVANNLFLDDVKHRRVVMKYQLQKPKPGATQSPHELLEEKEFRLQLEQAIARLTEKNRIVFLLNRIEKMTYKDIAGLLEISVKAVEKRMHKALKELHKLSDKI